MIYEKKTSKVNTANTANTSTYGSRRKGKVKPSTTSRGGSIKKKTSTASKASGSRKPTLTNAVYKSTMGKPTIQTLPYTGGTTPTPTPLKAKKKQY